MTVTLRLTVLVSYETNGTPRNALTNLLATVPHIAADRGLFTGNTDAEVSTWTADIDTVHVGPPDDGQ